MHLGTRPPRFTGSTASGQSCVPIPRPGRTGRRRDLKDCENFILLSNMAAPLLLGGDDHQLLSSRVIGVEFDLLMALDDIMGGVCGTKKRVISGCTSSPPEHSPCTPSGPVALVSSSRTMLRGTSGDMDVGRGQLVDTSGWCLYARR
ncbi:hypothetical protein L210DRAFT_190419 [Boletus edulis BED1]|uniref:Uncharacterized protein n=1 Tax=Boletus edulis BED1 TaxID=1328754 RepID=A0AAD4BYI7_BOLED|nr:hypothetical protein L210DRAFT_190419 [Boletus edulis BED1]